MENLEKVIFFAVAIKSIVEYISTWIVDGKLEWKQCATCIGGIALALLYGLDAFEGLGISARLPFVSQFLTGIVLSGGANLVYDIFSGKKAKKILLDNAEKEIVDIYEKG